MEVLDDAPDTATDRGREGRCDKSGRGDAVGGTCGASVESIPAHPEHAGSRHAEHHGMGGHWFTAMSPTFSEQNAENESGPSACHVYHDASGKIDGSDGGMLDVQQPAERSVLTPQQVSGWKVHHKHPKNTEEHDRREAHALCDGPDGQGGRDNCERELIDGPNVVRGPVGVRTGVVPNVAEEGMGETAHQAAALCETQTVSAGPPDHGHDARQSEALGENAEDVLFPDQSAVEKGEAGKGHEQHESGADHHPSVVARSGFTDERPFRGGIFEVGLEVFEEIVRPVVPVFSLAGLIWSGGGGRNGGSGRGGIHGLNARGGGPW